ncbi:related to pre-mRNA splicing factor [Rhynchosporium secalis]|uniref:U4/U6 snRNA-associated-splicing factor PRP24 n=1 Tax=Rhynchosporium secalis TaxID=38038 RepID=A0A1E1LYK8_RHYSE|nr:related to pre-mRNA splicing factor [Rhynchosporium secalis]
MADPVVVGEDGWLALVDEASRTAGDLEQRIGVVEKYKRAIAAEPWSNKLWLAYCEWFWSLYTDCQNGDAGWPEEEQQVGQELFSLAVALDVWSEGSQATQYRLNDSHELWNRWMSIELEQLSKSPTQGQIERARSLFFDRLQVPHARWDETSQMLSTFITKFDEPAWEATMIESTRVGKVAKELYSNREDFELKVKRAIQSGDKEAIKAEMTAYLAWESTQSLYKPKKGAAASPPILCVALYERALSSTHLGLESSIWEDYVVFLTNHKDDAAENQLPALLPVIQRATNHCPWSGALWARYILSAEAESLPFSSMEQIKHAATNTRDLDRDGIGSVIEFYIAWCGYLKRLTMIAGATDDDIDVAEMGLPTALEDYLEWGRRRHGEEYRGDPLFRIERILIQHLTQKGSVAEARSHWQRLVHIHADSYEFWQQYYLWEMTVRSSVGPPTQATEVLIQAIGRRTLDWPEKIMEVYLRHCHNYEEVDSLLKAMSTVHRLTKVVGARRQKEAAEAAVAYAQQQHVSHYETLDDDAPSSASKRKREAASEEPEAGAKKKFKSADQDAVRAQHAKRDRENTTVLVANLPPEVTQTKVRQYFKEYGHLNNVTLKTEADKQSTTALIEFRTPEEAQSALLRDAKYFGGNQLQVTPGTGLTLYVTNYPPTADDSFLRHLFKDCGEIFSIRWPSLKHNTHRRFCYISFRTAIGAAAATKLDGQSLGGKYTLSAKYSDPANKKDREGAMAEGREIHITSLDSSITQQELEEMCSKYGKVERARILTTMTGESKGAAFVAFERKEEATASLELDKTKFKSRILNVEMSTGKNFKPTATMAKGSSTSPGPDGGSAMSPSPAPESYNRHAQHAPGQSETSNRTITLMNIPDTVNVARVNALVEQYGGIVKVVLRPDHQGAIIEYADAVSAGKAALALENHEIVPGRKLRTGGLKDLFAEKDEIRTDRIQIGQGKKPAAGFMQQSSAPVRRPGAGGRGGLGQKRGLGYSAPKAANAPRADANGNGSAGAENKKPKSNADFKALFVSGGNQ